MIDFDFIVENPATRAIGWALLQSVWQGTAVACLVALVLILFARRDPRLRYGIAVAGLAATLALAVWTALEAYSQGTVRIGTPAITSRGMGPPDMEKIAAWMERALSHAADEAALDRIRAEVEELCGEHPAPGLRV